LTQDTLLDLSRWQWALTAAFHITFPAVTVGTSAFMVVCYAMYMRSDDEVWLRMFRFWRKIFAVGFALGVVSGIVLTFEFGLNWGPFAHDVGPIVGMAILMEVIMAFFLEAGFLGLLIYGEGRIGRRMMMFATCMVTLGTTLSVTWILVANSWMQTPAGYKVVNGQFQPTDWLHVIFNPSFGIRFIHMLVGVLLTAAWFIAGISAWYFTKRRHLPVARRGLSVALGVLAVAVPLQMFLGDTAASSYVAKYKFPELLAMEGHWNSNSNGENIIIVPKPSEERNLWQVTIPWLGSAIAKDWSGKTAVPGLKTVPKAQRPAVLPVFYGFHAMWIPTLLMMWAVVASIALRLRGRLFSARWFHKLLVCMTPIGLLGIWGGWVTAEAGRQPWIVYGKLLTAQAVSPLKPVPVLVSLILFIAIYMTLFAVFARYVVRAVREGPGDGPLAEPAPPTLQPQPQPGLSPAT